MCTWKEEIPMNSNGGEKVYKYYSPALITVLI